MMYNIQTRMNTGGSPASAQRIQIKGPREIRPPQITPRQLEAPFYKTPIDKVGPLIRNKAINEFGEVLIDVITSIADRKARLKADEIAEKYHYGLEDKVVSGKGAYFRKEGMAAIEGHADVVEYANELEQNLINTASPHTQVYLIPALRKEKNRVLGLVANFKSAQFKIAEQRSLQKKLDVISQNTKNMFWETPKRFNSYLNAEIDALPLRNQEEYRAYKDKFFGLYVQALGDTVINPGEPVGILEMLKRSMALGERIDAVQPYVSATQDLRHRQLNEQVTIEMMSEINRQQSVREDELKARNNRISEAYYKGLVSKQPFNDVAKKVQDDIGTSTWKTYYDFKKRYAADEKARAVNSFDFSTYAGLLMRADKGEGFATLGPDIDIALVAKKISKDESKDLLKTLIKTNKDINFDVPTYAALKAYASGQELPKAFVDKVNKTFEERVIGKPEAKEVISNFIDRLDEKEFDSTTYLELWKRTTDGEQLSDLLGDYQISYDTNLINGSQFEKLLDIASRIKVKIYSDAIKRAEDQAKAIYKVTGQFVVKINNQENLNIIEYVENVRQELNWYMDQNSLTRENADSVLKKHFDNYDRIKVFKDIDPLPTTNSKLAKPMDIGSLLRAQEDLNKQTFSESQRVVIENLLMRYNGLIVDYEQRKAQQ